MVQLRNGDWKGIARVCTGVGIHVGGDLTVTEPTYRGDEMIGVHRGFPTALNDGLLDHLHGVFGQQLQDPNVLPCPGGGTLAILEVGPQLIEARRQLPSGGRWYCSANAVMASRYPFGVPGARLLSFMSSIMRSLRSFMVMLLV
jgi:hypothetical protein